jgi:menaquinone-dependent protoporphyrinogen IX oxidase
MKVLVAYASRHGATRGMAERELQPVTTASNAPTA